jgi:hypothetical protein
LETTQAYPTLPQGTSGLPPYHLQGIGLNSLVTPDSAFAVVDKKLFLL